MKSNLDKKYRAYKFNSWLKTLETWKFFDDRDYLFNLVKFKRKTATSYLYKNNEEYKENEYSILENHNGKKKLLLKTTKLSITTFNKVNSSHARKEGEGNLSLYYWKKVHKKFFTDELKQKNLQFSEDLKIVLEEFKVIKKL